MVMLLYPLSTATKIYWEKRWQANGEASCSALTCPCARFTGNQLKKRQTHCEEQPSAGPPVLRKTSATLQAVPERENRALTSHQHSCCASPARPPSALSTPRQTTRDGKSTALNQTIDERAAMGEEDLSPITCKSNTVTGAVSEDVMTVRRDFNGVTTLDPPGRTSWIRASTDCYDPTPMPGGLLLPACCSQPPASRQGIFLLSGRVTLCPIRPGRGGWREDAMAPAGRVCSWRVHSLNKSDVKMELLPLPTPLRPGKLP